MINIYSANTTNFNNNGLVVLSDCTSCTIPEELNGSYELELEYPLDEKGKWKYLLEDNIIKADGQLFRIYHKSKIVKGIKINARHIFYDLLDNFLEDVRPTNLSGSAALTWILTHTQYTHLFTSVSDVGGSNSISFVRKNPIEAIMGTGGIINTYGGELVRDNFEIQLLGARGLDRGVLVSYGKNIQGIEETLDTDGLCTRGMFIGKDGLLLTAKYIDSPHINNYAHPKIRVIELNDYETQETLLAAGQKYMLDNKIDIPQFNYKIDFLELSKTEEYKNYAILERVYLGDTVTIKHSKLNINLKAKVIKITKNVLTNRIDKIELGSFKPNIATSINNSIQEVKKEIVQVTSDYQLAIDNATALITGSKGGNLVIHRNDAGQPDEILIMDTTNIMTAVNVWRFNADGLGHSSTGYNGPFPTAITQDGHIVASFITALVITGDQINGGTIKGVNIQQVLGNIILSEHTTNANGGLLKINDIYGNRNVSIGAESGTPGGGNVGGEIQLYNDGIARQRLALFIDKLNDTGILEIMGSNNGIRLMLTGTTAQGAGIFLYNSAGVQKSYLCENGGQINGSNIATQAWVIANFVAK